MTDKTARGVLAKVPEFRTYRAQFEVRSQSATRATLIGYASTFDEPYEMYDFWGPYTEVVNRGAFTKTLSEGADVAYLANHEGLTLARTTTGSLKISEDDHGLHTEAELNTERSDARDLVLAVRDGEVDQMSFAFTVVRQKWSPDYEQRDLVELNLNRGDVSAVNYGANPATSVGARSFRSVRAGRLAEIERQIREGEPVAPEQVDVVLRALNCAATGEDWPRAEEKRKPEPQSESAILGYLETLRMRMELDDYEL